MVASVSLGGTWGDDVSAFEEQQDDHQKPTNPVSDLLRGNGTDSVAVEIDDDKPYKDDLW